MSVKIINACSNLGYANNPVATFPQYLKEHGLFQMFETLNIPYEEVTTVKASEVNKNVFTDTHAKFKKNIVTFSKELASHIEKQINYQHDISLTIGGDHSVAIGSIYGLLRKRKKIGVLWIDAHTDIHTTETTETGWVYGMPTALILGHGDMELVNINHKNIPRVLPKNLCIFGAQYIDKDEYVNINRFKTNLISMDDIIENGLKKSLDKAIDIITDGTEYVHISLDLDAIDDPLNPGITEHYNGQFTYREIKYICKRLGKEGIVNSIDIVEGDPSKDIDGKTARLTLELIAALLGKNYSEYDATYLRENHVL